MPTDPDPDKLARTGEAVSEGDPTRPAWLRVIRDDRRSRFDGRWMAQVEQDDWTVILYATGWRTSEPDAIDEARGWASRSGYDVGGLRFDDEAPRS